MSERGRHEDVALLALLRLRPKRATWEAIANDVQLDGSAREILARHAEETLFEDPEVKEARERAAADLSAWEEAGLDFVSILSTRYPTQLAAVFNAPPFLFVQGTLLPADQGMSVVGSRKTSPRGQAMAQDAARILAERGLTVIAGLAEGIDTVAHRAAIDAGARTVAVIGTGIRRCYPASNRLLQSEIAEKGLVISQFYPDSPPTKNSFPKRNGTMSGYGMATIVVEASEHSGTRSQARMAAEHGRPVILSTSVATGTDWGAAIARNPWVRVVSSRGDMERAVDEVVEGPAHLLKALVD